MGLRFLPGVPNALIILGMIVKVEARRLAVPRVVGALWITAVCVGSVVTRGVTATVVVGAATIIALVIVLRAGAALIRRSAITAVRRSNMPSGQPDFKLCAAASMFGAPGVMRLSPSSLEWKGRRDTGTQLTISTSDITSATLVPLNAPFLKGVRLTFRTTDGREIKMSVAAPADAVESALRSP